MALSEDQKAILRLLAQRGEDGYGDLAALMGIGVEEVHAKAQEAAAQLESEGIPAPTIPPPPGQGSTEGAAPAAPPAQVEPVAPTPEPEPTPRPEREAPKPSASQASTKGPEPAATAKPRRTPPPRPNVSLSGGGGARAAIAAGALVLVALVLVLVLGGGEDSDGGGTDTTASERPVDATNGGETTRAVLEPVGGGDAEGLATFGRVKNSLALQVEASGLEPTGKGESYTIWLYESPRKMLPLASTRVPASGQIAAQVAVPTEVLGYLANETFDQIDISRTTDATLKASLAKATRERKAPIYTGTDVLRGKIQGPIIGAALP